MAEESFAERIRRLRRDAPAVAPAKPAAAAEAAETSARDPSWLRERLARHRDRGGSRRFAPAASPAGPVGHTRTSGPPRDLVERRCARGAFGARVILRPATECHGSLAFADVAGAQDLGFLARDPALEVLDPRACIYLDIETTGLSGGAGTWPFLIALGRFVGSDFELWQGFLRDPSEEAALLEETARRIAESAGVISFFGKSFDRHRLEDKMRLHRIEAPFDSRPHLDLYHPLNRLYTRRAGWERLAPGRAAPPDAGFPDGRLGTMERGLLGLVRELDLSGAHAPAAWFDFLAGRPHLLEEVFRHNAIDVWSLATLTAHLGRTLVERGPQGEPLAGPALARALGLAAIHRDRADRADESYWLARVVERLGDAPEPRALVRWRADNLRLAGDGAAALALFEELAGVLDEHTPAVEVARAKLLEHHAHDLPAALAACAAARAAAELVLAPKAGARFLVELEVRVARLEGKLAP